MANGRNPRAGKGRSRKIVLFPRETVSVTVESNMSEGIRRLAAEIQEKVLRPAAYAGARAVYDEMRLRVPVRQGTLYEAIYHWHDDKRSTQTRHVYMIGPNKAKAPHWYNVEYGHWRYNMFGGGRWLRSKSKPNARGPSAHDLPGALQTPVWTPANPYIRPTWDAKGGDLPKIMRARMSERMREVLSEIGQ